MFLSPSLPFALKINKNTFLNKWSVLDSALTEFSGVDQVQSQSLRLVPGSTGCGQHSVGHNRTHLNLLGS